MTEQQERIVAANVAVHTVLAHQYVEDEPHFRPENQAKVKDRLRVLRELSPGGRLLDLGCGTGFVLHLAVDHFDELHGIDATRAMLDRVDLSSGKITVQEGVAESVPFSDGDFDAVTAYSFLHHLHDHRPVLAEAFRVLRPGGRLYIDLEPNRRFWVAVRNALTSGGELDDVITREGRELFDLGAEMKQHHGIDPDVFWTAEHIKSELDGFDPADFANDLLQAGFDDVEVRLDWFLGQGVVHHGQSAEIAAAVHEHLSRLRPMTDGLFKYVWATARRP